MPNYGYTVIISTNCIKQLSRNIQKGSPKIDEINDVLRHQLKNPRYECHLDHLMLFNVQFSNNNRDKFFCIYVISLAPIEHPLFIKGPEMNKLLDRPATANISADVYAYYPSFRFNNSHTGDFFHLGEYNTIVIQTNHTNSHGNVRV